MAIFEIKSGIATIEFELAENKKDGEFYLSICAYGDFWQENFKTEQELDKYLKSEWKFRTEQLKQIKERMYNYE